MPETHVTIQQKIDLLVQAETWTAMAAAALKSAYPTRDPVCLTELEQCKTEIHEQLIWLRELVT